MLSTWETVYGAVTNWVSSSSLLNISSSVFVSFAKRMVSVFEFSEFKSISFDGYVIAKTGRTVIKNITNTADIINMLKYSFRL